MAIKTNLLAGRYVLSVEAVNLDMQVPVASGDSVDELKAYAGTCVGAWTIHERGAVMKVIAKKGETK